MLTLGELERSVMDLLWATDSTLSAYDIQAALADRKLAATTGPRPSVRGTIQKW